MEKLKDLKIEYSNTLGKVKDIQKLADIEKRNLSIAEKKEIDDLVSKGELLKQDIERREKIKALEIAGSSKDCPWENDTRKHSFKNALCLLVGVRGTFQWCYTLNWFFELTKKEKQDQEGLEKGIREGIEKEQTKIILNMLKKKADIIFISEVTGVSVKEIKKLKNSS